MRPRRIRLGGPEAGREGERASGRADTDVCARSGAICEERHIGQASAVLITDSNIDLGSAMNRYALAFLASLVLLSSAFAAVPWREMNHGPVYGYDDAVSSARAVAAN